MRIKTIFILVVAVLLTVVLMQNTERVSFTFLWATFWISKLVVLLLVALIAFILGVLIGRPKKVKRLSSDASGFEIDKTKPSTLSNEDKDYIN